MNWTRKDWIDLFLMAVGAVIGVAFFGFAIAPLLGIKFMDGKPGSYMVASVMGTLSGYILRYVVQRFRPYH